MDVLTIVGLIVLGYLMIGAAIGIYFVIKNMARFLGGGFRWNVIAKFVGAWAISWPVASIDVWRNGW